MSQAILPTDSVARAAEGAADGAARRFDGDHAAWLVSLLVHFGAMLALATITLALPRRAELEALSVDAAEDIEVDPTPQEFASSDRELAEIGSLSAGGGETSALALAPELSPEALVANESNVLSDLGVRPAVEVDLDLDLFPARGPELSTALPVQGAGSVGVTGAEGAIDRLTHEILASLEQRPTLVVWLFDESGSLRDERQAIIKRFRRIYDELGVIEAAKNPAFARHKDKPLLTAVVGFGAEPRTLTAEPTDSLEAIIAAVRKIDDDAGRLRRDASGKFDPEEYRYYSLENTFTAVGMVADKYHAYQSRKNGQRRVMIVVFTDEAGDDAEQLDDAIDACRKFAMPVYVVGRPAPFGRETAYVKWVDPDPKFDQRPQWTPVRLGPETLLPESLKLRFARGGEEELLDSGFGPFALTRLCYDTGGLYFATHPNREVGRTISGAETANLAAHFTAFFDPDAMRRYQPDYVSAAQYARMVQSRRDRRALVEAARLTWTSPLDDVPLRFPKRDEAQLAQQLSVAQRAAALLQPKLDLICDTLRAGVADRASEDEPRWQAGFDLALGRALAAKVRADGYNMMLAQAKQGQPFERERSNTWILEPAREYSATSLENLAATAVEYLERVQKDHPDTPWAMLAKRELSTPLGWRWTEGYTYLPPLEDNPGNNPRRPRPEPQGPPPPPRRDPPPL
jgi:hypothetical protein